MEHFLIYSSTLKRNFYFYFLIICSLYLKLKHILSFCNKLQSRMVLYYNEKKKVKNIKHLLKIKSSNAMSDMPRVNTTCKVWTVEPLMSDNGCS